MRPRHSFCFSLTVFSGLLVSVTLPCYHQGKFIGVTGTDINIEDLMPDILEYIKQGRTTYAFMISTSGRTLIHPLLPAPADAYGYPIYMDIRNLEQPESDFKAIFDSMIRYLSRRELFFIHLQTDHSYSRDYLNI